MDYNKFVEKQAESCHIRLNDSHSNYSRGGFGLYSGGIVNSQTGMGTGLDKSRASYFVPTRITDQHELETIYAQSWACAKLIDIPVVDQFTRWREFVNEDKDLVKNFKIAEKELNIKNKLAMAMKSGRLYGTSLACLMTEEAPLETPLDIRRIREGDFSNILVVNRFNSQWTALESDPFSKNYGNPIGYRINLSNGGNFEIHNSRVIRFDGVSPIDSEGFVNYDRNWGLSVVISTIVSLLEDLKIAGNISYLTDEANMMVLKVNKIRDAIVSGSQNNPDEPSLEQIADQTAKMKSIYKLFMLDKNDEVSRLSVNFTGLGDLMDRYWKRIAAASDIPATRFLGTSPIGMNATGEGDMRNYAMKIASDQVNNLEAPLDMLDWVLARHIGYSSPLDYQFPSLIDLSDKEKVDNADKKAQVVTKLVTAQIIDEEEGRDILKSGYSDIFENLKDDFYRVDDNDSE